MSEEYDISAAVSDYLSSGNDGAGAARVSVSSAIDSDPSYEAQLRDASIRTGVPLDVARWDAKGAINASKIESTDWQSMERDFPSTARFLSNIDNARLAHDDIPGLSNVEKSVRALSPQLMASEGPTADVKTYLSGLVKSLPQGAELWRQSARLHFADLFGFDEMARDANRKLAANTTKTILSTPTFETATARNIYGGLSGTFRAAPVLAGAAITRNPSAAAMAFSVQGELEGYAKYREAGMAPAQAILPAVAEGIVSGVTSVPLAGVVTQQFGRAGAGEFIKNIVKADLPANVMQALAVRGIETGNLEGRTWEEYARSIPDYTYEALIGTLTQSGVIGAANVAAVRIGNKQQSADAAVQGAQALADASSNATASKLRERGADVFHQLIDDASKDGTVTDVYISRKDLLESGVANEIAAAIPSVAKQLADASLAESDVRIPIADYLTNVSGKFDDKLNDLVRFDPNGNNAKEAREFEATKGEAIREEFRKEMTRAQRRALQRSSVKMIDDDIAKQLAATGRFDAGAARVYSAVMSRFFEAYSSLLGKMPDQLYAQYRPSIVSDAASLIDTGPAVSRATFDPETNTIRVLRDANLTSFLHETGHYFLNVADSISRSNPANTAVTSDMQVLVDWFGLKSLDEWRSLDMDGQRQYTEKFAKAFEAYLFSGRAPSPALETPFRRIKQWMKSVYSDFKSIGADLSPEVKGVFDRMLATDEQIREALDRRELRALFETPEQAGGRTPEEFAAYKAEQEAAKADAVDRMDAKRLAEMKWLRNARSRELKRLQSEVRSLRDQATADAELALSQQPVYMAEAMLRGQDGSGLAVKISAKALADMYGSPDDKYALFDWSALSGKKFTAQDGIHPDLLAERAGFRSGDEMVKALVAAVPMKDAVDAMSSDLMMQRHAELLDDTAMQAAADEAISTRVRSKFLTTEFNFLADATGNPRMVESVARQYAEEIVADMLVRDVKPGQFTAAERRFALQVFDFMKSGDIVKAADAARKRVLNNQLAAAVVDARQKADTDIKYLRSFDRESVRSKLPAEYAAQIDALRSMFDLKSVSKVDASRTASLRDFVLSRINAGEVLPIAETLLSPQARKEFHARIDLRDKDGSLIYVNDDDAMLALAEAIDQSKKISWKDATIGQISALSDTVKMLDKAGRLSTKLIAGAKQADYVAVRDELLSKIDETAKHSGRTTAKAASLAGKAVEKYRTFAASHIKAAIRLQQFDGWEQGGPWWERIVRPANERASKETGLVIEAGKTLDSIISPLRKKVPVLDRVGNGKAYDAIPGRHLNWENRMAIALNYGNESNLKRLIDGGLIGDDGEVIQVTSQQVLQIMSTLTAEELNAVQAIWDHHERYWEDFVAMQEKLGGIVPPKIAPRPFDITSADGQQMRMRGGYYPVVFDTRVNDRANADARVQELQIEMKSATNSAQVARSFSHERVAEVKGRPLNLTFDGMYNGTRDMIHFLSWADWVRDTNKLLGSKSLSSAIRDHYGNEVLEDLRSWRNDIVLGPRQHNAGMEVAAAFIRRKVAASLLGFNVMSAAVQPLGLTNSVAVVGASWIAKGVGHVIANPLRSFREASQSSQFIRQRYATRFREIAETRSRLDAASPAMVAMHEYAYLMMLRMQQIVDVPTWWGAKLKAEASGKDPDTAIALANQAVKDSQGGGEHVDLASIERGGPLVRLFTVLYTFQNVSLNAAYRSIQSKSKGRATADLLLLGVVTPILTSMLRSAITPGEDEEASFGKFVSEVGSNLVGLFAFGREFQSAAKAIAGEPGASYSGPPGLRLAKDTTDLAIQAKQGEFDDAFRKRLITVIGDLTGIPSSQLNRSINGIQALSEGKTENPAAVVTGYQEQAR